tara:strand:+ start:444 stop:770 length:327 start_codon:yes stop_codon:yes gene_type:complete
MAGKYWFANNPSGRVLAGSGTHDLSSIADGDEEAFTITVTGAALGDIVLGCSCSIDIIDLGVTSQVTAADTVTVTVLNNSGGALDLGSATFRVLTLPSAAVDDIIADM